MIKFFERLSINHILFFSFIVSCQIIYVQHGWITVDSILYFEMARLIADGDFIGAYQVEKVNWFLYPSLISAVHLLTSLSLQASANVIIVVSFAALTAALARLVCLLGGGKLEQSLAILMLFGGRYIVGDILPMASRDLPYWASMMWAVNFLILFFQTSKAKYAYYWQAIAIFATLFRIEGAVMLLALPLYGLIFHTKISHWKARLLPYTFMLIGVLGVALLTMTKGLSLEHLGRIKELLTGFSDIYANFNLNLLKRIDIMRDQVIGEPFKEFALFTFLISMFSIITIKCFTVAGWAPVILATSNKKISQCEIEPIAKRFVYFWLFTYWIIGCLIAFKVNLLSGRYVAIFGFALIAISSFTWAGLVRGYKQKTLSHNQKALLVICTLIVFIGMLGNLAPKRDGYHYEIDAVAYVKGFVKDNKLILYSSPRQRFYAKAPYESRLDDEWDIVKKQIDENTINNYEYLLIRLDATPENKSKESYLAKHLLTFKLDKTFYGYKKKKRILVYRRIAD